MTHPYPFYRHRGALGRAACHGHSSPFANRYAQSCNVSATDSIAAGRETHVPHCCARSPNGSDRIDWH